MRAICRTLRRRQIVQVAGIRQRVEHDDAVVGVFREPMMDKIRADEAGAASDEEAPRYRIAS
jgi:hypothetical protein